MAVGLGEGDGLETFTPFLHISFFPDLTQVYLIPDVVLVFPSTLQAVPGLTAASATG